MQRPEWTEQRDGPSEPLPEDLERAAGPQSGAAVPVEEAGDGGRGQAPADSQGDPAARSLDQPAGQQAIPQGGEESAPAQSAAGQTVQAATAPVGRGNAEGERLQGRWDSTYARFVNDPSGAAQEADAMVGEMLGRLTAERDRVRSELQAESGGDQTERLRRALLGYRALFDRLA